MKKRILAFFLLLVMLSALTMSAFAAGSAEPEVAGMYGIEGSGITPRTEGGDAIAVDNSIPGYSGFYTNAVKFDVSASGLAANKQYMLLVLSDDQAPTDGNIVYINQLASDATGKVTFSGLDAAYPSQLVKGETYYVYVVGEGKTFTAKDSAIATFQYHQPYTPGDVDDDSLFTATDAMCALQMAVGLGTDWTATQKLAANVDGDDIITATDAMMILQKAVGLITEF